MRNHRDAACWFALGALVVFVGAGIKALPPKHPPIPQGIGTCDCAVGEPCPPWPFCGFVAPKPKPTPKPKISPDNCAGCHRPIPQ